MFDSYINTQYMFIGVYSVNVHCTVGEPVFESFSLSVTVGHTCHNKHIWKV